jgi:hypothetical protein
MNEEHKQAAATYRAKAEAARNAPIVGFPVRLRLPGEREPVDGLRITMQGQVCYLVIPTPERFVETIFRPEEVEVLADAQEERPGRRE